MIHLIYGLTCTCKTTYAVHRAYIDHMKNGYPIVFITCMGNKVDVESRLLEMYPDDPKAFHVIDCGDLGLGDLVDMVNALSPSIKSIIIDDFSMFDGSSIDMMVTLRQLNELPDRCIMVVTHGYHDIINPDRVVVPYPKMVNSEAGMIATQTIRIEQHDGKSWIRAGSVDFVFDSNTQKIINWFDTI